MEEATKGAAEVTRPVMMRMDAEGKLTAESLVSPVEFKIRAGCQVPSNLVIPILFLPGVMGTRLRMKANKQRPAWFPPESTWEGLAALLGYLGRDAAMRQALLDPDGTEVDNSGTPYPTPDCEALLGDAPGETAAERAKWRGWGQLHADSYGEILAVLESRLAHILADGEREDPVWASAVMNWQLDKLDERLGTVRTGPQRLGAVKPFVPIDREALRRAAGVFYPVHAVGYNWLRSNKDSGEWLAREIDRIIASYRDRKRLCDQVILVTHSMGGLVARACCLLDGMSDQKAEEGNPAKSGKILGIVHGVMPAIGAPVTYKRMRTGFEGIAQGIFGRDASEATAVLAAAPGPLELLPTAQYRTDRDGYKRHWLRASHMQPRVDGPGESWTALGERDGFREIYISNDPRCWWRLAKEDLLNPLGKKEKERLRQEGKIVVDTNAKESDFNAFSDRMKQVNSFQLSIQDKYHPVTYAYYAADKDQATWNEAHWKCTSSILSDYKSADEMEDDLNGKLKIKVDNAPQVFVLQGPTGIGDNTVPEESGRAPTQFVTQIFRHQGALGGHESYNHQFSYKAEVSRAVSLYSIVRMVADSKWLADNLKRGTQ